MISRVQGREAPREADRVQGAHIEHTQGDAEAWRPGRDVPPPEADDGNHRQAHRRDRGLRQERGHARVGAQSDIYFEMQEYLKARRLLAMLNPRLKPITGEELTEAAWRKHTKDKDRKKFDCIEWLKELSERRAGKARLEGATEAQRAYARLREGRTHQHKLDFEGALPCYGTFLGEFARTPWATKGTLHAAYLMNQMPPGGRALRLPLLNLLMTRYPNSKLAGSAAFSRALTYERAADYEVAIRLYRAASARYPTREMRHLCRLRVAEIDRKMAVSAKASESKGRGGEE